MANPPAGVYFSANDRVMPWATAFLESFRHYNPDLPLILLPFDDRSERLIRLSARYGVDVHEDPAFAALDEMGKSIGQGRVSHGHHWFRRFAAFWGPLEHFLYLDSDIVVLTDLAPMLQALRAGGFDLLHLDCSLDQAYVPGEFRRRMVRQRAHGFNSGTWGARNGLFTLTELQRYAQEALPLLPQLNNRNSDQCFLNFISDTKGVSYANFAELLDNAWPETWARTSEIYRAGDRYYRWDHGAYHHNKRVLMLHWAGLKPNPAMPNMNIFLRFRLMPLAQPRRALARAGWWVAGFFYRAVDRLRRNRRLNVAYHFLRARLLVAHAP